MVRVRPLRALRYDPARADLARVATPPHDVVTRDEVERARREPLSIAHVVLPVEGGEEGRFAVAADLLARWQREGVLQRDPTPALYRYEVTHGTRGMRSTMRALLAQVGLDATHTHIRPHERTLARKRGDRLRLRTATQCDVEPIWLLYRDDADEVGRRLDGAPASALAEFTDGRGATHRLWRIEDGRAAADVARAFADRTLVIADGHHRYESALQHFAATGRPEDAWILACLARDADPGIAVEATHRVVRWGRDWTDAVALAARSWDVEPIPWTDADAVLRHLAGPGTVVLVGRQHGGLQAASLRLRGTLPPEALSVDLAQERLLSECWGLAEPIAGLSYERDAAAAVAQVARGEADLVVLLAPERVATVLDAAQAGRLMPAKATYFEPKPASGVVLGPLDEP